MKIATIIQARMSSTRCPGKVLRPVRDKPLLGYVLERMQLADASVPVILATSDEAPDDPVAAFCASVGVAVHRGPLDDVAERFRQVCERFELDAFVRVSGDSPLLDQRLVAEALARFHADRPDLVTNVWPRTFPRGQSVEVVSTEAFRRASSLIATAEQREHVTAVFYAQEASFRISSMRAERAYPSVHLAVDTEADFAAFERLVAGMRRPHHTYGLDEVVELYQAVRADASGAGGSW